MKSTTQGQHNFAQIPRADIQRSKFNRSCGIKTTFDAGLLIPIFCDEALPGDSINLKLSTFARLATPLHPTMDNMKMDTHFFAVPLRLLWTNFQRFMGEQTNPGDSTDYVIPEMTSPPSTGYLDSTIHDYLGLPTGIPDLTHSAMWHRAHNLIFNEWFRDENLTDALPVHTDDGPDDPADYAIQRRGKRHDYFTSCLPWPQKGDSVSLPLGGTAPVALDGPFQWLIATGTGEPSLDSGTATHTLSGAGVGSPALNLSSNQIAGAVNPMMWDDPGLAINVGGATGVADLSAATAATINGIRQAFQVQRLLERDARGGTRYTELIRSHFGVTSPDARLQRPEFLGGGTTTVNITPVPQTAATEADTPQGNLAGFGIASSGGQGFVKSFTEHCVILGYVSVRADLNYQQGLNRMFSRSTRFDFYFPALAHLGEQAVLNKEIYAQGTSEDEDVFGYQERHAEYRYKPSQITGHFRSTYAESLDTWHLAQDFGNLPVLDDAFIQDNPPVERIIAIPSEPHFLFDGFFNFIHARPMPTYSVPGLVDHF